MQERFGASVEWLPFELHPEYPVEGHPRNPSYAEPTRQLLGRYGLEANPPDLVPNTTKALRLTEHARDQQLHGAFHDRLMDAYWAEGRDLGSDDVLRALAAEVGLEGADEVLATDVHRERIRRSTEQAHSIGVTGVPAFLLDGRLLVLGAQPQEVFERAFAQLSAG